MAIYEFSELNFIQPQLKWSDNFVVSSGHKTVFADF